MKIKTVTVEHPNLKNRKITLLLVDNKLDIPSTKFLVYESRYGGRYEGISGKTSHIGKATKILELYKNLYFMNKTWRTAVEEDIKRIRNAMLCWDENNNENFEDYPYESISNDSMNHKIGIWFKFYKYMDVIGEQNNMVMTTRFIKKFNSYALLGHLNTRFKNGLKDMVEVWSLRVKSSPKKNSYHALSRTEFSILRKHLRDIDIVYEMLALFMVETGLRITAALEVKEEDFKGLFKLYASGKTLNDVIERKYIAKGDIKKEYDLPLRVIEEINGRYLMRLYHERLYRFEMKNNSVSTLEHIWILENGKELKKHDVWRAFHNVSKLMNRTVNKITPHWLRHTFATWTIIDIAERKGIPIENTGIVPNPLFVTALQNKLGHANLITTMKYIVTCLKLMGLDVNDGPIKISLRAFLRDNSSHSLVKREAMNEFGDDFDEAYFDIVKYALSRKIVVDDSFT
jgi:integrase